LIERAADEIVEKNKSNNNFKNH